MALTRALIQWGAVLVIIASCASKTTSEVAWWKSGYTAQQFENDAIQCRRLAVALVEPVKPRDLRGVREKIRLRDRLFASCLEELGYVRRNAAEGAPGRTSSWSEAPGHRLDPSRGFLGAPRKTPI